MRIAIDVSQVVYETGVSYYTSNLITNLLNLDEKNDYLLFAGVLRRISDLKIFYQSIDKYRFERKILPFPPTISSLLGNYLHLIPIESFLGSVDVFHSSDWVQYPSRSFKVTTVHDLVPIKYPQLSHPKIVLFHRKRLQWVKKEVDKIIAPSEATKADLVELGIEESRVVVIPEAPDPIFRPENKEKIEKIKKKYAISGKYLLAVGITARKNTERIIDAFKKVSQDKKLNLVIIGYPYIGVKVEENVIMTGAVRRQDLPGLYSGAEVLVYPSLYEGYGLPILEAFACQVPVVTSNLGSLKEIAGEAAILVNPRSTKSIEEGILASFKGKSDLTSKGVKRVRNFSWKKTAKMTLEVYKKAKDLRKKG